MNGLRVSFVVLFSILVSTKVWALYTPQDGLKDLLSEDLRYVGSYIPKYSVSQRIPVCLFKNSKVYVKYQYCLSEAIPAAQVTIHSVDESKGSVGIYAETGADTDVSQVQRQDYYDVLWYNYSKATAAAFSFSMSTQEYQRFDEKDTQSPELHGCVSSKNLNAPNAYQTYCSADFQDDLTTWAPRAFNFWKNPDETWYRVLKLLKQKVPTSVQR